MTADPEATSEVARLAEALAALDDPRTSTTMGVARARARAEVVVAARAVARAAPPALMCGYDIADALDAGSTVEVRREAIPGFDPAECWSPEQWHALPPPADQNGDDTDRWRGLLGRTLVVARIAPSPSPLTPPPARKDER